MKFRRRFATGGRLSALIDAMQAWWARWRPTPGAPAGDAPDGAKPPPMPTDEPGSRLGSWTAWWPFNPRRSVIVVGVFAGTLLLGYGLAATMLFPAPLFSISRSVPKVLGEPEDQARETLREAGFGVGSIERAPHVTVPAGSVIWQDPPPNVVAPETTEVALTISTGARRVPVPDIAGYDAEHARMLLEGAGLRIGSTESTQAPTPRNVAVNTRPPAGTTLPPGSSVVLVVSVGAATIRVPTLLGLTVAEGRLALETAGLALGTAFAQTTNAAAPGEIFYQEPSAGTLSAPGTAVNVRTARSP